MAPGIDWTSIEQQVIQEVMPFVGPLIGLTGASLLAFGTIILNRLKNKIASSEAADKAREAVSKDILLKSAADQGVQKAKEMSEVQFQSTGIAMTGQQKEAIAVDVVAVKAPDATPADAKSTVIASVGSASGEGASGKCEVKP
jgi:hypothetical protein